MIVTETEKRIKNSGDIAKIMRAILDAEHETDKMKEHFWVIGMNNKNVIQYIELVSLGDLTRSVVHPREVFRFAISKGIASIIICHNHPSGDPEPSKEDIQITRRLIQCGNLLAIKVLDHIIIGDKDRYYGMADKSFVDFSEMPDII